MRAYSILSMIALMSAAPIFADTAAACPALTPTTLNQFLAYGQLAFEFDDEGMAPTPLYLDITSITSSGAFQGTFSAAHEGAAVYEVNGTLTPGGTNVLAISFTYSASPPLTSYTYSGAIMLFASCNLAIAGTYSSSEYVLIDDRPPEVISAGPVAFSGKVVGYVYR